MGIDNMLNTIPGIIAPPIVGAMTKSVSILLHYYILKLFYFLSQLWCIQPV